MLVDDKVIISDIMVENIKVQMIPIAKYGRVIQFDFEKKQSPLYLK